MYAHLLCPGDDVDSFTIEIAAVEIQELSYKPKNPENLAAIEKRLRAMLNAIENLRGTPRVVRLVTG